MLTGSLFGDFFEFIEFDNQFRCFQIQAVKIISSIAALRLLVAEPVLQWPFSQFVTLQFDFATYRRQAFWIHAFLCVIAAISP
jgi:hypothetical protein